VIKHIADPNAECLRALEVLEDLVERKKQVEELRALSQQADRSELLRVAQSFGLDEQTLDFVLGAQRKEYGPQILKLIESLDKGEGVEIAQLFKLCELPEHAVESALNELLARGEVYEPTPGRLRKVSQ
jgi:Fic family protein